MSTAVAPAGAILLILGSYALRYLRSVDSNPAAH